MGLLRHDQWKRQWIGSDESVQRISKGETSQKKCYAVCIRRSLLHSSFSEFLNNNKAFNTPYPLQHVHENPLKKCPVPANWRIQLYLDNPKIMLQEILDFGWPFIPHPLHDRNFLKKIR